MPANSRLCYGHGVKPRVERLSPPAGDYSNRRALIPRFKGPLADTISSRGRLRRTVQMAPVILAYPRSVLICGRADRPPFMNNLRANFYTLLVFFFLLLSPFLFSLSLSLSVFATEHVRVDHGTPQKCGRKKKKKEQKKSDELLNVSRVPLNITSVVQGKF